MMAFFNPVDRLELALGDRTGDRLIEQFLRIFGSAAD
jgi:hypothetical protein